MSDEQTGPSQREESPNDKDPVVTTFNVVAAVAAVAGPIISLIQGSHYLFTIGLCLIISAVVFLVAAMARRLRRAYREASARRRQIATYVAAAILLAVGIPLIVTQSSGSGSCQQAATVSGADTSALQFTVNVKVNCTVPAADQLYLVEQLLNEGAPGTLKHSEYFIGNWNVNNAIGQQPFTDSPAGCVKRLYYVVSVTSDELQFLQTSHKTSGGSYYDDPIDSDISKYIVSNTQHNNTCNPQS